MTTSSSAICFSSCLLKRQTTNKAAKIKVVRTKTDANLFSHLVILEQKNKFWQKKNRIVTQHNPNVNAARLTSTILKIYICQNLINRILCILNFRPFDLFWHPNFKTDSIKTKQKQKPDREVFSTRQGKENIHLAISLNKIMQQSFPYTIIITSGDKWL